MTDVHVIPDRGRWKVEVEGWPSEDDYYATQEEAIIAACELARAHGGELVIREEDGLLRNQSV